MTRSCYSAACSVRPALRGAIQNASGRSNRKLACTASAARQISSAPATPTTVDDQRHHADVGDDAGLEQQRAGRRHRQEEGEIDHDRMFSAEAQEIQPVHPRQQRADSDDGAGAGQAQRQRDDRQLAKAERNESAIDERPQRESRERQHRMRPRAIRQREDMIGEQIAGIDVDEARAELVDHGPAGREMRHLQRGGDEPDQNRRKVACQFYDDEEDRQQVDEPQRAERLDEGFQILEADMRPALFGGEGGRLEAELDRHPQHVEVSEMHHLAVEIGAPVAVDHERQEKPGNQEEIRHPERLCEHHHRMHEAGLRRRPASTPSTECIITTMTMQMPLA